MQPIRANSRRAFWVVALSTAALNGGLLLWNSVLPPPGRPDSLPIVFLGLLAVLNLPGIVLLPLFIWAGELPRLVTGAALCLVSSCGWGGLAVLVERIGARRRNAASLDRPSPKTEAGPH